ncbi:hypothetical protein SBV1_2800014 [Verrucomicrobia bacterium]|nr:hypothetical protein SBV1_2800014 [Verrucomicrobiota bacterium]
MFVVARETSFVSRTSGTRSQRWLVVFPPPPVTSGGEERAGAEAAAFGAPAPGDGGVSPAKDPAVIPTATQANKIRVLIWWIRRKRSADALACLRPGDFGLGNLGTVVNRVEARPSRWF